MNVQFDNSPKPTVCELLESYQQKIIKLWQEELVVLGKKNAHPKVKPLRACSPSGKDLLSLLLRTFREELSLEEAATHLLERVRGREVFGSDIVLEAFVLLRAIDRVFLEAKDGNEKERTAVLDDLRITIIRICLAVVRETCDVYEYAFENSARGFCQLDERGQILFSNPELRRMMHCEQVEGSCLAEFFQGEDRLFIEEILSGVHGGKARIRMLMLHRPDGQKLPVGAEFAALIPHSGHCAGFASLVDLTYAMGPQTQIFDKSPLGILRINRQGCITYANSKVKELIGSFDLLGRSVHELFPDEANWQKVEQQLRRRFERGLGSEYEVEMTRMDDKRQQPVSIAAMPERDIKGDIVGSLAILRNLSIEKASENILCYIESFRDSLGFLEEVAAEVAKIVPYARMVVWLYTSDLKHARQLFVSGQSSQGDSVHWRRIPPQFVHWMANRRSGRIIDDYAEFVEQPRWQPLKQDPIVVDVLKNDLRSIFRIPVLREEKLVASVTFLRCGKNAFTKTDLANLNLLPLRKAVLMAIYSEEKRTERFRLDLVSKILSSPEDLKHMGQVLVENLVKHYGWQNASLFMVNEKEHCFWLLKQYAEREGFRLKPDYRQSLDEGVLGWVFQHRKIVNICDVRTDPKFKGIFKREYQESLSELCIPICINEKLMWLLNVEDSRSNAFSQDEIDDLQIVLKEVSDILKRAHLHEFLEQTLASASDAILVVDSRGRVVRDNPMVKRMLGYEKEDLRGKSLRHLFANPSFFDQALGGARIAQDGVLLRAKDKTKLPVFLTASPLPAELGGVVFIAKDLSLPKRLDELQHLNKMYQEVAVQTRPSLSLVFSWLRRLKEKSTDPGAAGTVEKVLKQLRKVELTYDRLMLAGQEKKISSEKMLLDPSEILERVRSELPEVELARIEWRMAPGLPLLRGDPFQLCFCLESILSYLMRFLPEEEKIRLRIDEEKNQVVLRVEGFFPLRTSEVEGKKTGVDSLSRTRMDMALGENIIRAFVDNHGGRYYDPVQKGKKLAFRIDLPAEGNSSL